MQVYREEEELQKIYYESVQEVYDRFYDVFGYLLPKDEYLRLIDEDINNLYNTKRVKYDLLKKNARKNSNLAIEGTPSTNHLEVKGDSCTDIFKIAEEEENSLAEETSKESAECVLSESDFNEFNE